MMGEEWEVVELLVEVRPVREEPPIPREFVDQLIQAGKMVQRKRGSESERTKRRLLRAEVLAAYGDECACCGEREKRFLTVDHIFNDGGSERTGFYALLKRSGFPKDRYQLLCWNCNIGKHHNGGICPHQNQGLVDL